MSNKPAERKICFVVSPIGDPGSTQRNHADWLLKGIIKPTFSLHFANFNVIRADEINAPGLIDSQVITLLLDAEIVIADMSFQNANVFYEMGIRHMKRRPIIHMFHEGHAIPFDARPQRAIPFKKDHPDDLTKAIADLKAAIEEVLKPGFEVENPVTRARGVQKLDEHAMPGLDVLRSEISELKTQMLDVQAEAVLAHAIARQATGSPPAVAPGRFATAVGGILGPALSAGALGAPRDYMAELNNAVTLGSSAPTPFGVLSPRTSKDEGR
jgi:hypothetical protein